MSIVEITSKKFSWCPFCKNKLKFYLEEKYKQYDITFHPKYEWCKRKLCLPFDFAIEELKIIIELDGEQHFSHRSSWYEPEKNLINYVFKMKKAFENGYSVIRILQEDVWFNNNKLHKLLIKYPKPSIFFIDKNDKYIKHIKEIDSFINILRKIYF